MAITRPRVSTCSCCSEFRLSSAIASVLVHGPKYTASSKLRYRLRADNGPDKCLSITNKGLRSPSDLSYPTGYGLDKVDKVISQRSKGSRWTVEVQRLLQPTRELVRSGYETGLEVKEVLLPGD